jgi:hypothetical protein
LKEIIRKLDRSLLGGALTKKYCDFLQRQWLAKFDRTKSYSKNQTSLLATLCDKYGSDKGEIAKVDRPYTWWAHTYADFYSRLFDHCRNDVLNVFECGIGTNNPDLTSSMTASGKPGASLRVWRDYFPNAKVFGADIDKDIMFEEERIQTFCADQTSPEDILRMWSELGEVEIDFFVDDGLHTFDAGICLFEHSIDHLAENGIYTIEDVSLDSLMKFKEYFDRKDYVVDYVSLFRPFVKLGDNNIVVIRKSTSPQ